MILKVLEGGQQWKPMYVSLDICPKKSFGENTGDQPLFCTDLGANSGDLFQPGACALY